MDEELQGGLNAITKPQPTEVPVDQEPSKESLFKDDMAERLRKERLIYDQHLQKMINALGARENRPTLDRELGVLASELGESPYFATGLGKGVAKMAEARSLDEQKKLEEQKTKAELLGLKVGQTEKGYALEEELKSRQYLKDIADKRYKQSPNELAVTDVSGMPLVTQILGSGSGSRGLITQKDIDLAPPLAKKQLQEDYKRQQEDIKIEQEGFKATKFAAPFKGVVEGTVNQATAVAKVLNDPRYQSASEDEQKRMMAITYDMIGLNEKPSGVRDQTKVPEIETASEKETRLKGEAETAKTEAEASTKKAETFFKAADTAQQRRISADNIERIAKANPKFFDALQNPTVRDALGRLVSSGVQTPWGSLSIDAKDLSIAVGNLMDDVGVTSLLGLDKTNIKRQDREAFGLFLRDLAIMQVAQRRSSNDPGQGSISDYEQRLFASTSFMKEDDARVQQLKAKMIKLQAKMDEDLAELLTTWQEKNKYKPIKNFLYTSPEFKQFKKSYEDKLEKLRNQNSDLFGAVTSVDTSSRESAPTPTGNYVDIIKQEKERRKL